MSSFVINKIEYVKAAGFIAATVETLNHFREPVVRIWNKRENRVYYAEDVYSDFVRLYRVNVAAVAEQYNDDEIRQYNDAAEYREEFERAKGKGRELMTNGYTIGSAESRKKLQFVVYSTINFFHSIQYQIEDDENTKRALRILNKYYRGLYNVLRRCDGVSQDDIQTWGSFDVLDDDETSAAG